MLIPIRYHYNLVPTEDEPQAHQIVDDILLADVKVFEPGELAHVFSVLDVSNENASQLQVIIDPNSGEHYLRITDNQEDCRQSSTVLKNYNPAIKGLNYHLVLKVAQCEINAQLTPGRFLADSISNTALAYKCDTLRVLHEQISKMAFIDNALVYRCDEPYLSVTPAKEGRGASTSRPARITLITNSSYNPPRGSVLFSCHDYEKALAYIKEQDWPLEPPIWRLAASKADPPPSQDKQNL